MKNAVFWIVGLLLIAVLIQVVARSKGRGTGSKGRFTKRQFVTANEQGMFWRLVGCFPQPEYVVLAQVSFGALLNAKDGASRYSFAQKRADFVVADKSFKVLAVIELDDSSHRGNEDRDEKRDLMLKQAGYKVLRYPRVPDEITLLRDLKKGT